MRSNKVWHVTSNWIRVPINSRPAVRAKRNDNKTACCARVPPILTYRQQLGVDRRSCRKGKILNMSAGPHLEIRKALSRLIPANPGEDSREGAIQPVNHQTLGLSFISLVYFYWSTHKSSHKAFNGYIYTKRSLRHRRPFYSFMMNDCNKGDSIKEAKLSYVQLDVKKRK